MENKNTKLIISKGLLYKIKQFFNKIFKKKKIELDDKNRDNYIKNNFKNVIIIKKDEEKEQILLLQQNFRQQKITEKEISQENIKKLNALYDVQILELKNKIDQNRKATEKYKKEIIDIKRKL